MSTETQVDDLNRDLIATVTRVEIIDSGGRSYSNMNAGGVFLSLQDDGKTLKVFTEGAGW